MSGNLNKLLISAGLRFADPADEWRFFSETFVANRPVIQSWLFAGGTLLYVFFVWDQIIDPVGAMYTHLIRGLILTPIVWGCGLALFVKKWEKWYELLTFIPLTTSAVGLAFIYYTLANGFDYGAVGPVLVILFGICAIPIRIFAFGCFCIISWIMFDLLEIASNHFTFGIFFVNNLSIGTAVMLGIFSQVLSERAARQQFMNKKELAVADARVNELLHSLDPQTDSAQGRLHILISYRRADTEAIAGRIRDRLVRHFGEDSVFMDIDSIPLGVDFREYIRQQIDAADCLLIIIGPNWFGAQSEHVFRIHEPSDPVRVEIEAALEHGISIIPVLVGGAGIPEASALPETLRNLSFLNAAVVDAGRDFHQHMDRLIRSLNRALQRRTTSTEQRQLMERV